VSQARVDLLRLVSHFPGRLRVRAESFRANTETADVVAERVAAEPGVQSVTPSRVTGSLLILYEPRELQLPRIVQVIVGAGGLRGLAFDAVDETPGSPTQGARIRSFFGGMNDALRGVTQGNVDLRAAVPGSLAAGGLAMLLFGRRIGPAWYDMLFWSFVTFSNLNPRKGDGGENDARRNR
jgi:hypothetical protein